MFRDSLTSLLNLIKPRALSLAGFAYAPILLSALFIPTQGKAQTYPDLSNHWSQVCVERLSERGIISGYPDGTFKPRKPVTRAEYAALVNAAFPNEAVERQAIDFRDIPNDYWAQPAIQSAYRKGFLSGYPNNRFRPQQNIPRVQAFVALASGLDYQVQYNDTTEILIGSYGDAEDIPEYGRNAVAATTQKQGVILAQASSNIQRLDPTQVATRAEVSAAICQAKYDESVVPSQYVAQSQIYPVGSTIVQKGNTEAELSYRKRSEGALDNFRLEIRRDGKTLLTDTLGTIPAGRPEAVNLRLEDFNGNGQTEVLAELIVPTPSGSCCVKTNVYHQPTTNNYTQSDQQIWNFLSAEQDQGYRLKDLDEDGNPELVSIDPIFRFAFHNPPEPIFIDPIQIWDVQQGELVNVTQDYPNKVYDHAYAQWQLAQRLQENESATDPKIKRSLAAYLVDKYLLGEGEEGWQNVRQAYEGSDREAFFQTLRERLESFGYT